MKLNLKALLIFVKSKLVNLYIKQPIKLFLILSILLLTFIKLNLIGTGFLAFPDEFRYTFSLNILNDISELNIGAAIKKVFLTQGRPADAILKTIPNAIQFITGNIFNLNYYESNNSYPLFIFNFIIYCFVLIIHFKFSKLVLRDDVLALISVLLFCSLTNNYLYLRHALPYDASLMVFYFIIYKIVKYTENKNLSLKKAFFLGIFSFLGYLIYPGYFPLYIIGLGLLFFNKLTKNNLLKIISFSSFYILGSIFCLIIFEAMSRFVGLSYIRDALTLSATVTQGSFEESFLFIFKYFFEVEFVTGIIITISLILFCFVIIYQIKNKRFKQYSLVILLGISVIGMYLIYASAGYFLHKMVFYGRLIHQYLPFICILTLFSINELIKKNKNKILILTIISFIFIFQFGINFIHYCSFSFPRDIVWKISKMTNLKEIENVYEYDNSWSVIPSNGEFRKIGNKIKTDRLLHNILAINCSYSYPVSDFSKFHIYYPNDNYILLESKPHFINFKAYQFEGFNIIERFNLDKMNLQIKLYSK